MPPTRSALEKPEVNACAGVAWAASRAWVWLVATAESIARAAELLGGAEQRRCQARLVGVEVLLGYRASGVVAARAV